MKKEEPIKVLFEENSPHGDAQAIVESDGQSVFFYLHFARRSEPRERMKACWVRNLRPKARFSLAKMRSGKAPMLPAQQSNHPNGLAAPLREALSVVWFEEGNGAALLEHDEVLAVIPPWSGQNGFEGYARDCIALSSLCWPLPQAGPLHERIRASQDYWRLWADENFWPRYRDSQVDTYERAFGTPHAKYYAIDQGQWPPKALLRFDLPDRWILATVGVSLRAQPNVEFAVEDASPLRRIEIATAFDRRCPENEISYFASYISGQTQYPWEKSTWFGNSHTLGCDSTPATLGGPEFPAVLFTEANDETMRITLPPFRGDPVNLLWMLPVSASERQFAETQGSPELLKRLARQGALLPHTRRQPAC